MISPGIDMERSNEKSKCLLVVFTSNPCRLARSILQVSDKDCLGVDQVTPGTGAARAL